MSKLYYAFGRQISHEYNGIKSVCLWKSNDSLVELNSYEANPVTTQLE